MHQSSQKIMNPEERHAGPGQPILQQPGEQRKMPALADDHAQRAAIAFLWALALERFRGYVHAKRGTDMMDQSSGERALDTASLRRAYADLDGVARGGGFRPPLPGEWDAEHTLAHIASADASIAAAALPIPAPPPPTYDNRATPAQPTLPPIILHP